jgi:hypothetical protein
MIVLADSQTDDHEPPIAPRPHPVDPVRAGRILTQVLDLAEALPAQPRGPLEYPRLPIDNSYMGRRRS